MSTTFGNNLERPCVDCGGHPLRAVHDRNSAAFTHYYVPPAEHEQPAPDSGLICKSHGLAVLVTHVNDGEPCSDYLNTVTKESRL